MKVMPHNVIGGHPWEHFQVICTKDVLSTHQSNPGIILDAGGSGVNLLFLLIPGPWLFVLGSKLLHRRGRRCYPHHPKGRSGRKCCKYGGPSLRYTNELSPNSEQGLVLLVPHLSIHVFVELRCHFCKRRTLVNVYPSMHKGVNTDKPNTYSFFLQSLWCVARRGMSLDLKNRTQGSADLQGCPNFQPSWCTLPLSQHNPGTYFWV